MSLSTADFVGAALAAHSASMRRLVPDLRAGDPDAYHDARVASRRLRSVLGGYCRPDGGLADELRHYAAVLGAVRDLDVAADRIALADLPEDLDPSPVLGLVASRRQTHFDTAVEYVDSSRHRALLASATEAAAEPQIADGLDKHAIPAAEQAVAAARKRLKRAERRSRRTNAADDRHRTRKRAKRVRYLSEGAASVTDGAVADHYRAVATRAEAVQDHLGLVTDAVVAMELLSSLAEDPSTTATERGVLHALAELERRLVAGHD